MFIYLLTNLINGKQYVGKSKNINPNARWNDHVCESKKAAPKWPIDRAIKKYGKDNFKREVI